MVHFITIIDHFSSEILKMHLMHLQYAKLT